MYPQRRNNGRVNICNGHTQDLFQMYDRIPVNQPASYRDATDGIWTPTDLSESFFCSQNIKVLQNGIRHGVYTKSNNKFVVGPQDVDQLKIIMRSVFLQNSINLCTEVAQQIEKLNKIVLDYAVEQVFNEAIGYKKYLQDVSQMYTPMERPVLSSTTDKQLVMKPWF